MIWVKTSRFKISKCFHFYLISYNLKFRTTYIAFVYNNLTAVPFLVRIFALEYINCQYILVSSPIFWKTWWPGKEVKELLIGGQNGLLITKFITIAL